MPEQQPAALRRHWVVLLDEDGVSTRRASLGERVRARLLAVHLDERLAAGEAPESDALLALRAARIARAESRREIALSVMRLLAECEPRRRRTSMLGSEPQTLAVVPRVVAAHDDLEQLVSSLLAPAPVSARGVAAASCLLRDGSGPLYRYESTDDLGALVRRTIDALDPSQDWPT
ncbi:MAG TPA: hypothetical protein VFL59_07855 [Candidatus Nanopelagicales bacterium]|nr:hypothetical protein [Candidatus Nanopelagicales bacterium]